MKFPVRIGRVSKVDFKTNFTMNMTKDKAQSIFCVNDIDLHGMHKGLEERVVKVRDDGAEWVDVPRVDQLLRSAQLDRVDERSHQVAR